VDRYKSKLSWEAYTEAILSS